MEKLVIKETTFADIYIKKTLDVTVVFPDGDRISLTLTTPNEADYEDIETILADEIEEHLKDRAGEKTEVEWEIW